MDKPGPELEALLHWLTDCPAEFYQLPIETTSKKVARPRAEPDRVHLHVTAIASDHLRDLNVPLPRIREVGGEIAVLPIAEQRLVAITVWLLREPWFMKQTDLADPISSLLAAGLRELAQMIKPELTVTDPDRREELVRVCLRELGYRPAGETARQARDRLNTLDSVERVRVISKTRAAEARARRIREAMARKRAQEAAARYSPE